MRLKLIVGVIYLVLTYSMDIIFYGNLPREDCHLTQKKVDQINIFNNRNPNNKYKNEIYRFSPK